MRVKIYKLKAGEFVETTDLEDVEKLEQDRTGVRLDILLENGDSFTCDDYQFFKVEKDVDPSVFERLKAVSSLMSLNF